MRMSIPRPVALIALAAVVVAVVLAVSLARAATTTCNVAASGGFANCLSFTSPTSEGAKSYHVAGRPYRFQLHRTSDGAVWGPWTWNDGNWHFAFISTGAFTWGQVDNQGSGTTAYEVLLQ